MPASPAHLAVIVVPLIMSVNASVVPVSLAIPTTATVAAVYRKINVKPMPNVLNRKLANWTSLEYELAYQSVNRLNVGLKQYAYQTIMLLSVNVRLVCTQENQVALKVAVKSNVFLIPTVHRQCLATGKPSVASQFVFPTAAVSTQSV